MPMTRMRTVAVNATEAEPVEDLELRLRRLRSRMAAEGRMSAVSLLDKAIERAGKRASPTSSQE